MSELELRQMLEDLDENGYQPIIDLRAYQRKLLDELGRNSHTDLDFAVKQEEEIPPEELDFYIIDDEEWMEDQIERASEKMVEHWHQYREKMRKMESAWEDYIVDWQRYQDGEIELEELARYGEDPEDFGENPDRRHQTSVRLHNSVVGDVKSMRHNLRDMAEEPYADALNEIKRTA